MRKKNLVTAVLVASMLVGSLGVTSTPAEAKKHGFLSKESINLKVGESKIITANVGKKKVKWEVAGDGEIKVKKMKNKIKVTAVKDGRTKVIAETPDQSLDSCRITIRTAKKMTITKANMSTAKKLHKIYNTGKPVDLKVKGSKASAKKKMKKLSKLVGKYNKYNVRPMYNCKTKSSSGYTVFSLSSEDTKIYKYGLLLVKDIVKTERKGEIEFSKDMLEALASAEASADAYVKEQFAVGAEGYRRVFRDVTGIDYDDYLEAQKPKKKTIPFKKSWWFDSQLADYELPQEWYYAIEKNHISNTSRLFVEDNIYITPADHSAKTYEDFEIRYMKDGDDAICCGDILKNYTFYYEPLKVDLASVENEVNRKRQDTLEAELGGLSVEDCKQKAPIATTDFCDLSQAMQIYYISQVFECGTRWCQYDSKYSQSYCGPLDTIIRMLNHRWRGICADYTYAECAIYQCLFGIDSKDIATLGCSTCNHQWSAVRVTNSKGQKAWLKNNYSISENATGYKTIKGCLCSKHAGGGSKYKGKTIENFIN